MKVPIYSNQQVAPQSLPNTQIKTPSVTEYSQIGIKQQENAFKAAQGLGQDLMSMAEQAAKVRVSDAVRKLREEQINLSYNKDTGFTNALGEDAVKRPSGKSLTEEYDELFRKKASELADGLSDEMQRGMFNEYAEQMRQDFEIQTTRHTAAQYDNYVTGVAEANIAQSQNEIGFGFGDPVVVANKVEEIKRSVADIGFQKGWTTEQIQEKARPFVSRAMKTAVEASLDGSEDPSLAEGYLKQFKDQMDADDYNLLNDHVTKARQSYTGRMVANGVMNEKMPKNMDAYFNGGIKEIPSRYEINKLIREKLGPEAHSETVKIAIKEANTMYDEIEKAKKERGEIATVQAMDALKSVGYKFSRLPRSIQNSIPADKRDDVIKYGEQMSGGDNVIDYIEHVKLMTDENYLRSKTPTEIALNRLKSDESHWTMVVKRYDNVVNGKSSSSPKDLKFAKINQVLSKKLDAVGIKSSGFSKKEEDEKRKSATIYSYIYKKALEKQLEDNKQMSDPEIESFVDSEIKQQVFKDGPLFFEDSKDFLYNVTSESDIPSADLSKIKEAYKKAGIENPSEDQIVQMYWKKQRSDQGTKR